MLERQLSNKLNLVPHLQKDLLVKVIPRFFITEEYFFSKCSAVLIYYEILPKWKTKQDKTCQLPWEISWTAFTKTAEKVHFVMQYSWCVFLKMCFFVSAVGNLQYLGVFNRLPDCEHDLLKLCCFESAALKLSLVLFRIRILLICLSGK